MQTDHEVVFGDARRLDSVDDDSVHLVVTSPPYPMIEMWDEMFADLDEEVAAALDAGDGAAAFEAMHDVLDEVWAEVDRVLVPGGIACINIGDATRTISGEFELYPNHAEIISRFRRHGFQSLPTIHWRKPTNSKTKFMGSGMIPPNQYVTLEHEQILVFRNGGRRSFPANSDRRYESAYFWEERNEWFSDTWTDILGANQALDEGSRNRAAAYPLEVPYRLICMYSAYGDTVLDPFLGTGTTTEAAVITGRDSVGVELDEGLVRAVRKRLNGVCDRSRRRVHNRLTNHREFAAENNCKYDAEHYDFGVKTKQERRIRLYETTDIWETSTGYRAEHKPYDFE